MKLAIFGAVMAASVAAMMPASAEVIVHAGNSGVVVKRHADNGHHYGWRNHRAHCRTISVRTHRPNGTIVIRKRTVC